ncbi:MreB/Mbl protein [Actinomadura madurae]|uniref:MreB/Mbl protein n=1 Tax=Actinomadura madurae TaxID=1993 RepID=A0A1I5JY01_9ACTN|nr:rod shape-determining protein [Actinomadura madurae]SFO77682.1 MreB/Mbl protein [Actinomadura madurae]
MPAAEPSAGLDLGSSRVRAVLPALDMIIDRPATAAGRLQAAGGDVRTAAARPIEHGMVTDARACTRLTRLVLLEAGPGLALRQILLAVPSAASRVQLGRATGAVRAAAGCPVRTLEAPLAAAVGAGIGLGDPRPRLVVDIGAGIVETAVVIRGRVHSVRSIQYLPEHRPGHPLPRLPEHVRARLTACVRHLLDDLPAPLRRAARDVGLVLTGGGARLPSLPGRLTAEMGLTVTIARDPARATVRGLAHACRAPDAWRLTDT